MNSSRLGIRTRITGGSLLIAILISVIAGIVIYTQVERLVNESQARILEGIAGQYVTAITTGDTEELDMPGHGQLVLVVDSSGAIAVDTFPADLAAQTPDLVARRDGTRTVEAGSAEFLVRSTSVDAADGTWHVITASDSDTNVLDEVAWLLIVSIAVINIAFGASSWLIGSAALGPVSQLRRSAAALVASPSTETLPVGAARDEISELAETLNTLIAELRASAERERQIVSDASHEIRTPLAIIQTRLELAQREARSLDDMKVDVAAAQRTLARLSSLAASLLELSRIDAQHSSGSATVGALVAELAEAADRGRLRVADRNILIDYTDDISSPSAVVAVSEEDFGRVCDNLVGNAVHAIRDRGSVQLRLAEEQGAVILTVTDDGGGMNEDFVPLALDRFSRQSEARTGGGAGLGLPIVAGIAANAGGLVELRNDPGVGLCVSVRLPTRQPHGNTLTPG
ncbi:HAMP domain-containing histidine kinase [Microbacterium sp. SSW1-49]|uniref:histidine kinase n=1 Tax=Microbacterium croceum TaxID=2851645 RepID=A0ABT0FCG8_9MICO|nr:HAMP domain-containing sensor histidine kinase [Microbacterium croceum]MCK2035748.1 HAMP domain-containing histidine kinase [Microbacterium croceum]